MICFTQMSHQFLHLHARVIDLLLPLLAYSMYAGNVISHDPNFAQSNSAWSKSCSIQILHNTNFAWSKHCIIQILHDPNFARSKFCTIQTMHDPNVVESVFFFSLLPSHFLVCCFFYTFCWFLHPGKAWQCCFTVWNILIQALWESSWCFQWSKATSVVVEGTGTHSL